MFLVHKVFDVFFFGFVNSEVMFSGNVTCFFWPNYVSTLRRERWVVRALNWLPEHARRVGRPAYSWDSMIQSFCRHKQIGNWRHCAHDTAFWMNQLDDFISFTEIC